MKQEGAFAQKMSYRLHNCKSVIVATIEEFGKMPEAERRKLAPLAEKLLEASKLINDVEFSLDANFPFALRVGERNDTHAVARTG